VNVCKFCTGLYGAHLAICTRPTAPATRVEWFGSLQVHQPVRGAQ